jgi:hypothetical protein
LHIAAKEARRYLKDQGSEERRSRKQEAETQAQTVINLWIWTRLPNLYTAWLGTLMRVTYSGLTQSVFRLDRVKSSSFDCQEKIPVDFNASCFTSFSSVSSSQSCGVLSNFALGLFSCLGLSLHLRTIQWLYSTLQHLFPKSSSTNEKTLC